MDEDLRNRHHGLLFDVRRSVRYHDRRQGYYEAIRNLADFIVIVFGSATLAVFGASIGAEWPLTVKLLPAVLATVLTGIALVYGVGAKSALHASLKRRFIELQLDLEDDPVRLDEGVIAEATRKRLRIEADEPPVLRVLDTLCHNDLLRAMGYDQDLYVPVGFWQRLFAPFFDLGKQSLRTPG